MDTVNNYLVFTSLLSFSVYMISGSFRQIQEVVQMNTVNKNKVNKNIERSTQTDSIPLLQVTPDVTPISLDQEEREPSIRSNFTCISSGNKFKNLFKF